jgi:Kef-type K+ transport system membrane component KefB
MLAHTFFAIALIVFVARSVGLLFQRFHQPLVIGEIVGGLILGPTVVGAVVGNSLFPIGIRPSLNLVGQLGLALYMFLVGLRLNLSPVRSNPRMVSAISLASILVPFALAMPLAAFLFQHHGVVAGRGVDRTAFYLFVGTSLSITAFPVLARILEDRRMQSTELGAIAMACAAIQDVIGWGMLATVLAISSAHGALGTLARIAGEAVGCAVGIFVISRVVGWLGQLADREDSSLGATFVSESGARSVLMPVVVVCVLLCAGSTQAIGLHAVFGAFLFGAVLRRSVSADARQALIQRLNPITAGVLLPVYFITPGLSVNLRTISPHGVVEIALILVAACAGKVGGAWLAARSAGLSSRQSAIMGTLMNTRGLIELVVLQVALSAGILDQRLFSELVFMAVVTTMLTPPLLALLLKPHRGQTPEAQRAKLLALEVQ